MRLFEIHFRSFRRLMFFVVLNGVEHMIFLAKAQVDICVAIELMRSQVVLPFRAPPPRIKVFVIVTGFW